LNLRFRYFPVDLSVYFVYISNKTDRFTLDLLLIDVQYWKDRIFNWISLRNFVIAPLAEELIFRACVTFHLLPLFSSCVMLCFVSSLFFSLAHFHHVFESVKSGQDLQSAFKTSLFQVFYTTLFGTYSGFLMLRTATFSIHISSYFVYCIGNIASSIVTHSLCNFFGLPDLIGAIERAKYRWGVSGQIFAIGSHLLGLLLWAYLLYQITETKWSSSNNCRCDWY
uniref:CAAX prenyl protease 2 n=1 Tax=Schistosoma curassoni TaxID=6186 RepID=A0A183JDF1_9TREM